MKQQTNNFIFTMVILFLCLTVSCKKEISSIKRTDHVGLTIEEAKTFFKERTSSREINSVMNKGKVGNKVPQDQPILPLSPHWEQADTISDSKWYVVDAPIADVVNTGFIVDQRDNNFSQAKSSLPQGQTRVVIFKHKETGKMESAIMRIMPENNRDFTDITQNRYGNKTEGFSGIVIFSTLENRFINGWKYSNGAPLRQVKVTKTFFDTEHIQKHNNTSKTTSNAKMMNYPSSVTSEIKTMNKPTPGEAPTDPGGVGGGCFKSIDWYQQTCYNNNGKRECTPWEYIGSTYTQELCTGGLPPTSNFEEYVSLEPDEFGSVTLPFPNHGGNFLEALLSNVIYISDEKPAITDIDKYLDCFKDGKTASSYKLTLYVKQPIPGSSEIFKYGIKIIPEARSTAGYYKIKDGELIGVGHAFVGFEKHNTDGTVVRQVLGFYPTGSGISPGKGTIKDNGGDPYDVSFTVTVTESYFSNALNNLKTDFNTANYILDNREGLEYNCADAAIKWMNSANANLSNTSSNDWIFKNTPAEIGQALRDKSESQKTSGNASQSKGPCN